MKKIGVITYHAPYNYGGCLQAYALQKFFAVNFPNIKYEIINFRSNKQKELYMKPNKEKSIKKLIKKIISFNQKNKFKEKGLLFEEFINKKLNVTEEINNDSDLFDKLNEYDYYLCGSDQIWNPKLIDFNWNYYLEFAKNSNRISYAASFGSKKNELSHEEIERIKNDLKEFKSISVREESSLEFLKSIGIDNAVLNVDPTLLVEKKDWFDLVKNSKLNINNNDYILYYDVKDLTKNTKIAEKIQRLTKSKIVITRYSGIYSYIKNFKKVFNTGPIEFLDLIKNSKFVLTSSFHGVVFSLIFKKPFLVIDGMNDLRIKDLLIKTKLEYLSIDSVDFYDKLEMLNNIDYTMFDNYIEKEIIQSKEYINTNVE